MVDTAAIRIEAQERQAAELEFVRSAYDPETEAWFYDETAGDPSSAVIVVRRLQLLSSDAINLSVLLKLRLSSCYPVSESLIIDACEIEQSHCDRNLYDAMLSLRALCRAVAAEQTEESILLVWQAAEEWIADELPKCLHSRVESTETPETNTISTKATVVFARNLIYSHHIIGKQKRADMKALASELDLTGYVKIGWPGIIIIEGLEDHCHEFYDTIRQWAWQYLVRRGEMREEVITSVELSTWRRFSEFLEVDSMSLVADHCRSVGLEDLFLTSMKGHLQQQNITMNDATEPTVNEHYGALVHVDHMNDPKSYRKWLQRSALALDVSLLIQQCFLGQRKAIIVVGLASLDRANVSTLLKKWRSQRVDVDARGQPCLERRMTVLVEGPIAKFDESQWETTDVNTTFEKLERLMEKSTQTKMWVEAVQSLAQF